MMKQACALALLLGLVSIVLFGAACAVATLVSGPAYSDADVKSMIGLVNRARAKSRRTKGPALLVEDPRLAYAARQYALELVRIVESGLDVVISPHQDRAGSTPRMRMTRAGFHGTHWGENEVVTGVRDIEHAQAALEASSSHLNNMLGNYDKIGIGTAAMSCARVPRLSNLAHQGRCRDLCDRMADGEGASDDALFLYFIVQDFGRSRSAPSSAVLCSRARPVYTPPTFDCNRTCSSALPPPVPVHFVPIYSPTLHLNFEPSGALGSLGKRDLGTGAFCNATASPDEPAPAPSPINLSSTVPHRPPPAIPAAPYLPPALGAGSLPPPYVPVMGTGNQFELRNPRGNVILKVSISQ